MRTLFDLADVAIRVDDVLAVESGGVPLARDARGHGPHERRRLRAAGPQPLGVRRRRPRGPLRSLRRRPRGRGARPLRRDRREHRPAVGAALRQRRDAVPSTPTCERWHARDWDGVLATLVPRLVDHRALTGLDLEGEELVRNVRHMFGFRDSRWNVELLATRGERLALSRLCFAARGSDRDAGMSEVEFLDVYCDRRRRPAGRERTLRSRRRSTPPTPSSTRATTPAKRRHTLDAAAAARAMALAWARRDWDALHALCAPSFAYHDHRLLGWGTLPDAAAWVRAQRALVDLAPDVRIRRDHVRMCDRGCLLQLAAAGHPRRRRVRARFAYVAELDDAGRYRRVRRLRRRRDRASTRALRGDCPVAHGGPRFRSRGGGSVGATRWRAPPRSAPRGQPRA